MNLFSSKVNTKNFAFATLLSLNFHPFSLCHPKFWPHSCLATLLSDFLRFFLKKFTYLFYFLLTKQVLHNNSTLQKVEQTKRKTFAVTIRIRIFQFLIVIQTAVYVAERFIMHWNFSDLKNPRFIIKSGFKSRAGYNGARTVVNFTTNISKIDDFT